VHPTSSAESVICDSRPPQTCCPDPANLLPSSLLPVTPAAPNPRESLTRGLLSAWHGPHAPENVPNGFGFEEPIAQRSIRVRTVASVRQPNFASGSPFDAGGYPTTPFRPPGASQGLGTTDVNDANFLFGPSGVSPHLPWTYRAGSEPSVSAGIPPPDRLPCRGSRRTIIRCGPSPNLAEGRTSLKSSARRSTGRRGRSRRFGRRVAGRRLRRPRGPETALSGPRGAFGAAVSPYDPVRDGRPGGAGSP
jgi:hypothetical protein